MVGLLALSLWVGIPALLNPAIPRTLQQRATVRMPYDEGRFLGQESPARAFTTSVVGIGPGHAEVIFGSATHNVVLRVLVENGGLAAGAFVVAMAVSIWLAIRSVVAASTPRDRASRAVAPAALLGSLATSVFIDSLHWRHLWFLVALCIWQGVSSRRDVEENNV